MICTFGVYIQHSQIRDMIVREKGGIVNLNGRNYWIQIRGDETIHGWLENNVTNVDMFDYTKIEADISCRTYTTRICAYHEVYILINRYSDIGILNLLDLTYVPATIEDYIILSPRFLSIDTTYSQQIRAKNVLVAYMGYDCLYHWSRFAKSLFQSNTNIRIRTAIPTVERYCMSEFFIYATKQFFGKDSCIQFHPGSELSSTVRLVIITTDIGTQHWKRLCNYNIIHMNISHTTIYHPDKLEIENTCGSMSLAIESLFHTTMFWDIIGILIGL